MGKGTGLLIAGAPCNWHRPAKPLALRCAKRSTRWPHLWQNGSWNIKDLAELVAPLHAINVEQERATGVGNIRRVHGSPRQPPDEKCVDRTKKNLTGFAPAAESGHCFQQVHNLGRRKIRIQKQAGASSHLLLEPT